MVQAAFLSLADWITDAVLNAAANYTSFDCRAFATVVLEFLLASASAPDGQLIIEWSSDETNWYPYDFTGEQYNTVDTGVDFAITEATGEVDVTALSADAVFSLIIQNPPQFMRGRWISDSGGTATGMAGNAFGRVAS